MTPRDILPHSNKLVWWKCGKGHVWEAKVIERSKGCGCTYCSGRAVDDKNCLAAVTPELAVQWHPSKNGKLTPFNVAPHAAKKVWWKCEKGHEWQAQISCRNSKHPTGCPYCSNRKLNDENCLAAVFPLLAKEWHPGKNKPLTPKDISPHSGKRVWWRCKDGHEWQATVSSRANGTGCQLCNFQLRREGLYGGGSPKSVSIRVRRSS
jgi:hypothetical protein